MSNLFKKNKKEKIPEDLGLVITSKNEEFWKKAIDNVERSIKEHEDILKIDKAVLEKFKEMLEFARLHPD